MNQQDVNLEDKIKEVLKVYLPKYFQTQGFTVRKLTDTPTDRNQVTPMGYVNMYGSVAGRPSSSVVGQQYFDTDLGYPIFKNQNTRWVNSVGSVVG